jgi:hypothetical protein
MARAAPFSIEVFPVSLGLRGILRDSKIAASFIKF